MFLILTSKDGQFHSETGDGLIARETYDYMFYGQCKARFVIAEMLHDVRVRIVEETSYPLINNIPVKFFPKFATLEQARAELHHLIGFGHMQTALERVA